MNEMTAILFTHQHQGVQLKLSEAAELVSWELLQTSLSLRELEFSH